MARRTRQRILEFYRRREVMTYDERFAPALERLPRDVAALVRIVQGIVLHEYLAAAYGATVPERRKRETHLRSVGEMLERHLNAQPGPLDVPRRPEHRLVGICRHFTILLVATLRAKSIPARGRYGFATYFNPAFFDEHIVAEYWNEAQARWVLVDAQLDAVWRRRIPIDFDHLDVPHDRFITAGDAWRKCRVGEADPRNFGIYVSEQRGLWFVASEVMRDLAALNNMEMLPWDVWGAMPSSNDEMDERRLALFDRLARLTQAPDDSFDEMHDLYKRDERLRVPKTVLCVVHGQREEVLRAG
jgi:hypothetical protein